MGHPVHYRIFIRKEKAPQATVKFCGCSLTPLVSSAVLCVLCARGPVTHNTQAFDKLTAAGLGGFHHHHNHSVSDSLVFGNSCIV